MKISEAKQLLTQVVKYNIEQLERGKGHNTFVVPFFMGDPGVGKTAIPKQVSEELGLNYHQTIVAQYDAGEMAGLPMPGQVNHGTDKDPVWVNRMIRMRPSYLPDPEMADGQIGIYNLDELPQAFLANQNICSQIVNEYRVGEHQISPGISICATGNKPENKAGTTTMPTHLRDRLAFIEIEVDHDDWLVYAASHEVDPRVRAYIRQNPARLHKFTVAANANPTPRSWEKVSAILSMDLPKHIRSQTISGQIGAGEATTFETYIRVEDRMPKLEDILTDPDKAPVFDNRSADILYLLLANLADVANEKNITNILKYLVRLPNPEFQAVFAQDAFSKNKKLLELKPVTEWKMRHIGKILY